MSYDNREPEPCADGECRHTYDDWPAGSVTRRDREIDQCSVCGWTSVECEERTTAAGFTPDKLTARIVRDLKDTASPVTGNIEYACSIWLEWARSRPSSRVPEAREAAEAICAALNRRNGGGR